MPQREHSLDQRQPRLLSLYFHSSLPLFSPYYSVLLYLLFSSSVCLIYLFIGAIYQDWIVTFSLRDAQNHVVWSAVSVANFRKLLPASIVGKYSVQDYFQIPTSIAAATYLFSCFLFHFLYYFIIVFLTTAKL